ncbi:MAG: redoxin domain-containing protein [Cytophagales bacterium]|nr:redoxin domain-containing protein [Cytophagales bacterium]
MQPQGQPHSTCLRLGEPVPPFEAISHLGPVKLADYRGKWLVLFSYPADFTPVCTSEVVAFSRIHDGLKSQGCALLGLSTDSVAQHLPWLQAIENWMGEVIRFPVIGDANGKLAHAYGLVMPGLSPLQAARCTLVIDPDQVLQAFIAYPSNVGRDVEEVLRLVKALQTTQGKHVATPANWQPDDLLISLSTPAANC